MLSISSPFLYTTVVDHYYHYHKKQIKFQSKDNGIMKCSQYRVNGIPPYFISLIFKKYMCQYNTVAECESKRGSTVSVLIN